MVSINDRIAKAGEVFSREMSETAQALVDLKAVLGDRVNAQGVVGPPLNADELKRVLSGAGIIRRQGLGRFVQDFVVGNSGFQFRADPEAIRTLAWELGFKSNPIREPNEQRRNEAARAFERLAQQAGGKVENLRASFEAGVAGRVSTPQGEMWIKSAPTGDWKLP